METVVELLRTLTALPGIPGREEKVVDFLMKCGEAEPAKRWTDASGNAWVLGEGPDVPPVVFCAHMDEVGFRVKRIEADGRLSVVGHERLDLRTLASEVVQVWTEGGPVDAFVYMGQQTNMPRDYASMVPDTLRLDLGVCDRASAEALGVGTGDPVVFDPGFRRLAGSVLCAKAFDDRSGLAAILKALAFSRGKRKQRPLLLGSVQEEIGGHGAGAVEFPEKPGAVIIVDICGGEVYGLPEPDRRPILGRGPILHDGPTASRGLIRRFETLASEREIPVQHFAAAGRGADLSVLQKKSGGLPALGIILPMAFYHGPRGLIDASDVLNAGRLLAAALEDETFLERATKF